MNATTQVLTPAEVIAKLTRADATDVESVGSYFDMLLHDAPPRDHNAGLPASGDVCYDSAKPEPRALEELPGYIQDTVTWTQARTPGRRIVVSKLQGRADVPAAPSKPRLRLVKGG